MSCWTKQELENMLEDVVNELDLSDAVVKLCDDVDRLNGLTPNGLMSRPEGKDQ